MTARIKALLTVGNVLNALIWGVMWIGASWPCANIIVSRSITAADPSSVDQYFRFFLLVMGFGFIIWKAAARLLPTNDQEIAINDGLVSGLVCGAAIIFLSSKWLGPLLNSPMPLDPPNSWLKHLGTMSEVLLAFAATRLLNARITRLAAMSANWIGWKTAELKEVIVAFVMVWFLSLCQWAGILQQSIGTKLPIRRVMDFGTVDITVDMFIMPVVLCVFGLAFWHLSRDRLKASGGLITETPRNGYPMLSWSQTVSTSETVASNDTRLRFLIYLGMIGVAAFVGIASGNPESLMFYLIAAVWLGALGLRGAGKYALQGQTLVHIPHSKSESERREELTPMTRREDCEAYVEKHDEKLWFCVARGNAGQGALAVVERVPFDSFGNFEEGSHKQWFRPRGSVNETLDWGVIVAQSSVGRIVLVAQSLDEQAWLIELLVKLQTTFIGPRDGMLQALKEAEHKRRAHDTSTGRRGASADEAPIKPF